MNTTFENLKYMHCIKELQIPYPKSHQRLQSNLKLFFLLINRLFIFLRVALDIQKNEQKIQNLFPLSYFSLLLTCYTDEVHSLQLSQY